MEHVELHDCSVVCVPASADRPAFAYTVGLFQRFKVPEIILFGLPAEESHEILMKCRDLCKGGEMLRPLHAYEGVLRAPYRVAIREVDYDHYETYLGDAIWFYDGEAFPVIQAFWPDKSGKMPWDAGCDPKVASVQPRLDHPWPFRGVPVTQLVWTLKPLVRGERPILRVIREEEDEWQLLGDETEIADEDVTQVTLAQAYLQDPTIGDVWPLEAGYVAVRVSKDGPWEIEHDSP